MSLIMSLIGGAVLGIYSAYKGWSIKNWKLWCAFFVWIIMCNIVFDEVSDENNFDNPASSVEHIYDNDTKQREIPSWLYGKWLLKSYHPSIGEFQVVIVVQDDGQFGEVYQSHNLTYTQTGYITDVYDDKIWVKYTRGSSDSQYYPINNSSQKIGYGNDLWLTKN